MVAYCHPVKLTGWHRAVTRHTTTTMKERIRSIRGTYVVYYPSGKVTHKHSEIEEAIAIMKREGLTLGTWKDVPVGTVGRFLQYDTLCKVALAKHKHSGWTTTAKLTPELIGYEGKRITIVYTLPNITGDDLYTDTFYLKRSHEWAPHYMKCKTPDAEWGHRIPWGISVKSITEVKETPYE